MKSLNKSATKTFQALVNQMVNDYAKISRSSSYMPVIIEKISENAMGKLISLSHYGVQNGDLMADPEVVMILALDGFVYPTSIRQDYLGTFQDAVKYNEEGKIESYQPRLQADIASFANLWLRNIKNQQNL
ncbi:MAG: hypothetical protein HQM08_01430 [Candidatus Riflebacteria bacterium]|nr:hypothetical protein [Candidatus Riflebacteria bacterium]